MARGGRVEGEGVGFERLGVGGVGEKVANWPAKGCCERKRGGAIGREVREDERESGWMFSSLSPISAFVLGVKRGGMNWVDSFNPAGSEMPCTVPDFTYSDHADPVPPTSSRQRFPPCGVSPHSPTPQTHP